MLGVDGIFIHVVERRSKCSGGLLATGFVQADRSKRSSTPDPTPGNAQSPELCSDTTAVALDFGHERFSSAGQDNRPGFLTFPSGAWLAE